jgi:ParB-like chromosome segregation protein Spo0J
MARKRSDVIEESVGPIRFDDVKIVDRPEDPKSRVFFNSRQPKSFTLESLIPLMMTIRRDGLLQNVVVRENEGVIELIAGERRIRSISLLREKDVACLNSNGNVPSKWRKNTIVLHKRNFCKVVQQRGDDVTLELLNEDDEPTGEMIVAPASKLKPTLPATKRYSHVVCNIIPNCSDEMALAINMAENRESQPLTIEEEIAVVERLIGMGLKQDDIKDMLGTNITWVSQTASFRRELPPEAFDKLMAGGMRRNLAVGLMGYAKADRPKLYKQMVVEEQNNTAAKIRKHQLEQDAAEDEAEILTDAAERAETDKEKAQAKKKAAAAKKKADAAKKKKEQAEEEAGQLKQGDLEAAAVKTGTQPKKLKILSRKQIEDMVERLDQMIKSDDTFDPLCEKKVTSGELMLVRETLSGVLIGVTDPLAMVRTVKVSLGKWDIPDHAEADEDEEVVYDEDEEYASDPDFDADIAAEYDGDYDVYDEGLELGEEPMDDTDNWD